jgi:archaellum component FlaD/FlaE
MEQKQTDRSIETSSFRAKIASLERKIIGNKEAASPISPVTSPLEAEQASTSTLEQRVAQIEASISALKQNSQEITQKINGLDNSVSCLIQHFEKQFQDPKPFSRLSRVDGDVFITSILLKWLEFILGKVGEENLSNLLKVYVDLGWINEDIQARMLAFSGILFVPNSEEKRAKLQVKEHIQSLLFIEKLREMESIKQ